MKRIAAMVIGIGLGVALCSRGAVAQEEWEAPADVQDQQGEVAQEPGAAAPEGAADVAQAPAASPPSGQEGLISVDFKDADIRQVLRVIALKSDVDIVAGTDVEGLVTIKLTGVPWEQALDIILRTYGFTYERKGRIVRVLTIQALEQEALATEVFPLDYAKAKDVPTIINEMLSERGRIKSDERTNTIIVTDIPSTLFQIKEVIERLDQRTPQVLVESKVVETKLEKSETLGINWSDSFKLTQTQNSFASTFPFQRGATFGRFGEYFLATPVLGRESTNSLLAADPLTTLGTVGVGTLSSTQLSWTLNALKSRTETHIVSNPTVAVLNNQKASIHIGEEYPIPSYSIDPSTGNTTISGYTPKNIGTVLTVTPHVNPSKEIVVDLKPEVIAVGTQVTFTTGTSASVSLPRFTVQTAQTSVRIKDGETIAIGGLVKTSQAKAEEKVPLLGDVPILGWFFTNRSDSGSGSDPVRQDLLIFLTVSLMEQDQPAAEQAVASAPAINP